MRKSNWIIAAVLLLASVAFLWIWHALQFDLVDNPLDIVVTVVCSTTARWEWCV